MQQSHQPQQSTSNISTMSNNLGSNASPPQSLPNPPPLASAIPDPIRPLPPHPFTDEQAGIVERLYDRSTGRLAAERLILAPPLVQRAHPYAPNPPRAAPLVNRQFRANNRTMRYHGRSRHRRNAAVDRNTGQTDSGSHNSQPSDDAHETVTLSSDDEESSERQASVPSEAPVSNESTSGGGSRESTIGVIEARGTTGGGAPRERECDRTPYTTELPLSLGRTKKLIETRANHLRRFSFVTRRKNNTTAFVMMSSQRFPEDVIAKLEKDYNIDKRKWTLVAQMEPFPNVVLKVEVSSKYDLPSVITRGNWLNVFSANALRTTDSIIFHALSLKEILRLMVIAVGVELNVLEARSACNHRVAVAQTGVIVEAYGNEHVRGRIHRMITDDAGELLTDDMKSIGYAGSL